MDIPELKQHQEESHRITISAVISEAQTIVKKAAMVYLKHFGQQCQAILLHGSAFKGGFIPGCSDIDLQIYLEASALQPDGSLPLELCIAIHNDLARIDPTPFQYIQGYALSTTHKKYSIGPIPGAYTMLMGTLPVAEATEEELQQSAREALEALNVPRIIAVQKLLQHGGWKLPQQIRFICTDVWPKLYQVLTIETGSGIEAWRLSKPEAIQRLQPHSNLARTIQNFYDSLYHYYPEETSIAGALNIIRTAEAFLNEVKTWWLDKKM